MTDSTPTEASERYEGQVAKLVRDFGFIHKGPPLDTPQLAGGRKAEIRRRRIR